MGISGAQNKPRRHSERPRLNQQRFQTQKSIQNGCPNQAQIDDNVNKASGLTSANNQPKPKLLSCFALSFAFCTGRQCKRRRKCQFRWPPICTGKQCKHDHEAGTMFGVAASQCKWGAIEIGTSFAFCTACQCKMQRKAQSRKVVWAWVGCLHWLVMQS